MGDRDTPRLDAETAAPARPRFGDRCGTTRTARGHPPPGLTVVEVFDTMRSICEYRRDHLARADEDAIADELRPA